MKGMHITYSHVSNCATVTHIHPYTYRLHACVHMLYLHARRGQCCCDLGVLSWPLTPRRHRFGCKAFAHVCSCLHAMTPTIQGLTCVKPVGSTQVRVAATLLHYFPTTCVYDCDYLCPSNCYPCCVCLWAWASGLAMPAVADTHPLQPVYLCIYMGMN